MKIHLILLIVASLICNLESKSINPLIIGGEEVEQGEFNFLVAVLVKNQFKCAGNLIQDNVVITTASCLRESNEPVKPEDVEVVAGAHDLTDDQDSMRQPRKASQIKIHENYNQNTKENDIAAIILDYPVIPGDNVGLVELPSQTPPVTEEPTTPEPTTTEPPAEETTTEPPAEETTTEPPAEETTTEPPQQETTTTDPPKEETTTTEPPKEETTTTEPPEEETTTTEPPEEQTTTTDPPKEDTTTTDPPKEDTTTSEPPKEETTTTESPEEETTTTEPPKEETTTTESPEEETTTTEPPKEETTTTEPPEEETTTTEPPKEETTTTEPPEEETTTTEPPKEETTTTEPPEEETTTTDPPKEETTTTEPPEEETTTTEPPKEETTITEASEEEGNHSRQRRQASPDVNGVTIGWGIFKLDGQGKPVGENSPIPQKLRVTRKDDQSDCKTKYGSKFKDSVTFCAGAANSALCNNDEGGPFFVEGVLQGFVIDHKDCAIDGVGALYTNVAAYASWIETIFEGNPPSTTTTPGTTTDEVTTTGTSIPESTPDGSDHLKLSFSLLLCLIPLYLINY